MTKRVLIVDDNEELRQLVRITLDNSKLELSEASDASEALKMITANPPDLIVLDVMMLGKMNGFQLCECLKNHLVCRKIKIILLTAKSQRADILEGVRVKSDAYLAKPFSPAQLQNKVFELLELEVGAERSETAKKNTPKEQEHDFGIPPRPASLINIQLEMKKLHPDMRVVTQQIAADITLSAAVLKTINSPYYALRNKVTSVFEAVNLLGLTRILNLVTGVSMRNSVPLPAGMEQFWDEANKVAIINACIARNLVLDADMSYLMGLFHDAAIPLMAAKHPDYLTCRLEFHVADMEITEAEQNRFNMNHAMLGGLLARAWYLPAPLIDAIRLHHSHNVFELGLDNEVLNLLSVHLLADKILDMINGDIDTHYELLEEGVKLQLGLTDEINYQSIIDLAIESVS